MLIGAVVLLIIFSFLSSHRSRTLSEQLDEWKIHASGLEGFEIEQLNKVVKSNIETFDVLAKKSNQTIKISRIAGMSLVSARDYLNENQYNIESLFEAYPSPYPDAVTNTIECPKEFKPLKNESSTNYTDKVYYVMYASQRFTYGVCSKDLAVYKSIFALVFCKNKNTVYKIEYFIPNNEFEESKIKIVKSFSC